MREFSNTYPANRTTDWSSGGGLFLEPHGGRGGAGEYGHLGGAYHSAPGSHDGRIRPYSAGSRATTSGSHHRKYRSHDGIVPPLTKQVDQLLYEIPEKKFTQNALCQPPEFLKVFSDVHCFEGEKAVFDCVLLGSPRPKVCWLFNNDKMSFVDVALEDTSDVCRCTIKYVRPYHYGTYTVLAENEAGRAITTASLLPILHT